ncbi:coronin Ecym_7028 [Eremothecium cymbalariae DBVPG|uniref:Coronin n=1 Tax=Eremothecium cymbalariae (strain CBS 270.75 / DBVPG 7215 / KCTC 17166 / NRRL Y-17582) TaxID=931890 RepID=G8JVM0_ERECY|nr:hypothetical protein Ecym_7028 [Eremothecium cymbalariae DBVPG\
MSGKFVRASKYRHVFGQSVKKELHYENLKVTINAWDSNLIKTNGKYISINWNASGGGAFAVVPVEEIGKAPDQIPLFRGHTAQILDTDFDPFNDQIIASSSDDTKIAIWEIPSDYSFHNAQDEDGNTKDVTPVKFLMGHTRKVGHVLYHPTASNILASSSLDHTVRIWNVETGETVIILKHPDMVTSMSFSYNGDYLATCCRDKKLRVWDIRKQEVVSEGQGHSSPKNQRVVWLGNSDRLATTGFSKLSDRQIGVWDAFNIDKGELGGFYTVDQSSGILMPFYDDSNKILYVAGKGDGNIRYFEFQDDELFALSEFQSTDPQRGFAVAPKKSVNVKDNEVLRAYKTVRDHCIEPISFVVPRKAEVFQNDIYPDAPSGKPALTAEEWLSGKSVEGPILFSVQSLYDGPNPVFSAAERSPNKTFISESPKSTPDKSSTKVIKEVSSPKILLSVQSEKPKVDKVLNSDETVNKMLQKACELDQINKAENPGKETSGWDSDDEHSGSPAIKKVEQKKASVIKPKLPSPSQCRTENVPLREDNSLFNTPKKEPPRMPTLTKGTPNTQNVSESQLATPASARSLGLKQSVEKLSELVLNLETVVSKLAAASLERDNRLKQVEDKIELLLKK